MPKKLTTASFIDIAKLKHGDRYDYSKVDYINYNKKIIIICPIHGEYLQGSYDHLYGKGCSKCGIITSSNKRSLNTNKFIEMAKQIYGNKYDYSKVEYINSYSKIRIICPVHGEFLQIARDHLSNHGCSKCSNRCKYIDTTYFTKEAQRIHKDKYDYSKVGYVNNYTKVIIVCQTHGEYKQRPSMHLCGQGCPKCAKKGYSKMAMQWLEFMEKYNDINIQHMGNSMQEYKIKSTNWHANGYCKSTNTIYEFHGDYWHGNPKRYDPECMNDVSNKKMKILYKQTLKREHRIKELGYNLVVMWESDWTKAIKAIIAIQHAFKKCH